MRDDDHGITGWHAIACAGVVAFGLAIVPPTWPWPVAVVVWVILSAVFASQINPPRRRDDDDWSPPDE